MPNLAKALIVFSCWVILALTSHYFLSKYQSNFCNQFEDIKPEHTAVIQGTHFYFISNTKDTIASYKSQNNTFENKSLVKKDINSLSFVNELIDSLKNDYRLKLEISYNSFFNSNEGENILITEVKSKFKSALIDPKMLNFSANNKIHENSIDFKLLEKSNQLIDSIEQSITSKTLYLEFEKGKVIETEVLALYSSLLNQYLQNYSEKTILITGHTSNVGYFENNLKKGLQMANSLKDYLIKNQNTTYNIKTFSRGEAEPIADKNTKKGRLLNQRIVIKIN